MVLKNSSIACTTAQPREPAIAKTIGVLSLVPHNLLTVIEAPIVAIHMSQDQRAMEVIISKTPVPRWGRSHPRPGHHSIRSGQRQSLQGYVKQLSIM